MNKADYWIILGASAMLLMSPYIFYYNYMYNELEALEDLMDGKSIKCGKSEYKLDDEHYLMLFYDEAGRNNKSITIMKKQSDTVASGVNVHRCEKIPNSKIRDVEVSIVKEYNLQK